METKKIESQTRAARSAVSSITKAQKQGGVEFGDAIVASKAEATAKRSPVSDPLASPFANESGTREPSNQFIDPIALLVFLLAQQEKTQGAVLDATGKAIGGQIEGINNMIAIEVSALQKQGKLNHDEAMWQMGAAIGGIAASVVQLGVTGAGVGYAKFKTSAVNKKYTDEFPNLQNGEGVAGAAKTKDISGEIGVELQDRAAGADYAAGKETGAQKLMRDKLKNETAGIDKIHGAINHAGQAVGMVGQSGSQTAVAAGTMNIKVEQKEEEAKQAKAQGTKSIIQSVYQLVQELYSKSASRQEQLADQVMQAAQRFAAAQAA